MQGAGISRADVVLVDDAGDEARALGLAARLGLPLVASPPENARYVLRLAADGLWLWQRKPDAPAPLKVDFASGKAAWRQGQGEMIIRAAGCKGRSHPHVLDATAGLGRDAFVLASHGFRVTLLERDPLVHALLADGLARAADAPLTDAIVNNMRLHHADLLNWRPADGDLPDVVYLDPMFPARRKSAKVKKEMALLQDLLPPPAEEPALLDRALELATVKVVVKRPLKAPRFADRRPSGEIRGRSTRFDIYSGRGKP